MKKIVLVGRQNIINPRTKRYHDDTGLFALDGILFGKPREIEDSIDPLTVWRDMKKEFESDNPDFHEDRYAIRMEDGKEIEYTTNDMEGL